MSKKILACVLTLCILLTSISAFAATYTYFAPSFLPEDGMDIEISSTGADGEQAKLVLTGPSAAALGLDAATVSNNALSGAVLSADLTYTPITYVTFTDGKWDIAPQEGKVVDVFVAEQLEPVEGEDTLYDQPIPIAGTYYDEEGNVLETCTIVKKQVAASSHPEKISVVKTVANQAKTAVCINVSKDALQAAAIDPEIPLGKQFGHDAWKVENVKLYPSEISVDSGVFPEGTVFISSSTLIHSPGAWITDVSDGYYFYRKGSTSVTADGPYALLTPKVSGTYDVYCLIKEADDANYRTVALRIGDSGEYIFTKNNATSTFSWYWEKEKTGKTVTLTEGKSILVQCTIASAAYGRFAGIALVPTSKNFAAFPDAASAHTNLLSFTDFEFLHNETITTEDITLGEAVTVTVDEKEYSVEPGTASAAGVSVPTFHKHGEFIANPTVWDALAAAGITKISDKAIYVNNKVCYSPEYTYLAEGDKITTTNSVNVTNFSRTKLVDVHNTEGSASLGGIKMCLTYSSLGSVLGSWAQVSEALLGCYFTGYFETLDGAVTALGLTAAGDKIYFESLEAETQQQYTTSRVDLQLDDRTKPGSASALAKTMPDGVTKVHAPYAFVCQKKNDYYSYDNVYMVNSTTPVGVTAVKLADGKYALDTEGDKLITIVTVTYNDDGSIKSTELKDDYITFNKSAIVEVADNQTVYVWGRRAYNDQPTIDGTTMVPLCAPITK